MGQVPYSQAFGMHLEQLGQVHLIQQHYHESLRIQDLPLDHETPMTDPQTKC